MVNQTECISLMVEPSNGAGLNTIKHILVADDNHANQLIAKTILERDGHKVSIAANGEEAVIAFVRQASFGEPFDVILMDILMPVMDGIKALRRIKALSSKIKTPPIFAITAYCSPADQRRYNMAGFDAVLTKPLKHGDLEQTLQQHISGIKVMPVNPPNTQTQNFKDIALLDDIIINQLRIVAKPDRLTYIQETFWKDVSANSEIIKAALPEAIDAAPHGLAIMRKSIHTIKGASANIGLLRATEIARHLQNAPPSQIGLLLKTMFDTLFISKAPLRLALSQSVLIQNCAEAQQSGVNARTG